MAGAICDIRGGSLISGSQSPSPPPSTDATAEMDGGNGKKSGGVLESTRELL